MPQRVQKPITSARRGMTLPDFRQLTKVRPPKKLTRKLARTGGRNNTGRLTVRHQAGGAKRIYRVIDFKMNFEGKATVGSLEYDPNRTAYIALLALENGKQAYIVAPQSVKVGDLLEFGPDAEVRPGNRLMLKNIPVGTTVYNIELTPGRGGQLVRSAGGSAQIAGREEFYVLVKLPSGEMRRVLSESKASIGAVSNPEHGVMKIGKAGRKRHMGIKPTVRGSVMDPTSHPHGGGEGKSPIGMPGPKTPWGKPALGYKTRKPKYSDSLIIRRRTKKSRKR